MSLVNTALLYSLGVQGPFLSLDDEKQALAAGTQAGATPILGSAARFTRGAANASAILKSIVTGEAPPIVFVVNDGANTIVVFPAVGEKINNVTNASLSIAAGAAGLFIKVPSHLQTAGADWRAIAIV